MLGMGMAQHRRGWTLLAFLGNIAQALDSAGRAGDEEFGGFGRKLGRVGIH